MDTRTPGNGPPIDTIASGLKVTTLVVVVGVLLAFADHSLVTPREGAVNVHEVPAATATYAVDGFAIPDELRTRADEVPAHVEAF